MIQCSSAAKQSNPKWTSVRAAAFMGAAVLALSACAGTPGNAAGGSKDEYYLPENTALYAPEDATVLKSRRDSP